LFTYYFASALRAAHRKKTIHYLLTTHSARGARLLFTYYLLTGAAQKKKEKLNENHSHLGFWSKKSHPFEWLINWLPLKIQPKFYFKPILRNPKKQD
jgi:hypothetical protein